MWQAALLLAVIVVMIYVVSRCECANAMKLPGWLGGEGMTGTETTRTLSKIDRVFDKEDNSVDPGPNYKPDEASASYDPIQMGALKQTEVDAHKRALREMSPFATYGPAGPRSVVRDDDEYMRNTGVVWIGGRPRTVNKVMSGPQAGARQVTSTSERDIRITHIKSMNEPTWG